MTTISDIIVTRKPPEYISALLEWSGTGTTWRLLNESGASVYEGANKHASVSGVPGESYTWTLTALNGATAGDTAEINYTFPSLPTPFGLHVTSTTSDGTVVLRWSELPGITSWDIAKTSDAYAPVMSVSGTTTATITGLAVGEEHAFAVRAKYAGATSHWSLPITATVSAGVAVASAPTTTDISPLDIAVWNNHWNRESHVESGSDGASTSTVYATYGTAVFDQISERIIVSARILMRRPMSGAAEVPPRIMAHTTSTLQGEPSEGYAGMSLSDMQRNDSAWVDVPPIWLEQVIAVPGFAGFAIGGTEQPMMTFDISANDDGERPFTIRITHE